jgi:biopolymer transport protein ExbB
MSFLGAFDFLNKGGWVAWVLAILSCVLWYGIGYRFLLLQSSYLSQNPESILNQDVQDEDVLGAALMAMQNQIRVTKNDLQTALEFVYRDFLSSVSQHRTTIQAVVVVAPLLGLLGTVIGMIETFDSLQDSALFSQSGGIAGGISQALITTQMGLVVAIPGLLIGRKLDAREQEMSEYLERAMNSVQLEGVRREV